MDAQAEAARPWVEEASPEYLVLVDQHHLLSSLYNMVNVPQAVWIDEAGRIVRPTETGGSLDILREFDFEAGGFKPEAQAAAQAMKTSYMDAVRDWVANGADSRFVFDPDTARAHVPTMTDEMALAHAHFQLGQYLDAQDRGDEAQTHFDEARRLHPDSWNIFRETEEKLDNGIAGGEAFWQKVMGLGDKAYYAPIDLNN